MCRRHLLRRERLLGRHLLLRRERLLGRHLLLRRELLLGRLLRHRRLSGLGCWRGVGDGVFTTEISQRRIVHHGIKIIVQVKITNRLVKGSSFTPELT